MANFRYFFFGSLHDKVPQPKIIGTKILIPTMTFSCTWAGGLLIGMQLDVSAEVRFRVRYGAPQLTSRRKRSVNLYRRTSPFCPSHLRPCPHFGGCKKISPTLLCFPVIHKTLKSTATTTKREAFAGLFGGTHSRRSCARPTATKTPALR